MGGAASFRMHTSDKDTTISQNAVFSETRRERVRSWYSLGRDRRINGFCEIDGKTA